MRTAFTWNSWGKCDKLIQDSWPLGWDLKKGFPAYRAGLPQFGCGIPWRVQHITLKSYLTIRIRKCNWQQLSNVFHVIVHFFFVLWCFRLLRQWLCSPLCDTDAIRSRQDAVTWLLQYPTLVSEARGMLSQLPDLERLLSK
jgi:Mismatch repair ATPase (MutS family)